MSAAMTTEIDRERFTRFKREQAAREERERPPRTIGPLGVLLPWETAEQQESQRRYFGHCSLCKAGGHRMDRCPRRRDLLAMLRASWARGIYERVCVRCRSATCRARRENEP